MHGLHPPRSPRRFLGLAVPLAALALALTPRSARSAPVGDPVPDPDIGRLRLAAVVDMDAVAARDTDCSADSGCDAIDQLLFTGAELQLALSQGLGLVGSIGRAQGTVDEADFNAAGVGWALGAKGALPLTPVWSAYAQARFDHALPADSGPTGEKGQRLALTGTLGLSWGAIDSGFAGHLGVQSAVLWSDSLHTMGDDGLQIDLRSRYPASGVVGLSFASEPLGTTWNHSPRLVALLEGRAGQSTGAGLSLGVAF